MTDFIRIAGVAFSGALLFGFPDSSEAQISRTPKALASCLPPGGRPAPCGTARAGQTLRLQLATTILPTAPIRLRFVEEAPAGRSPRTAVVTVPPERSLDGGYEVTVPGELCAGSRSSEGQFEIQMLTSDLQNAEGAGGDADSIGLFQMRC